MLDPPYREKTIARTTTNKRKKPARQRADPIPAFGSSPIARDVETYCRRVLGGQLVAGRLVRLAVLRHVRDLVEAEARGYVFSEAHAEVAIVFIESCCKHSKNSPSGHTKAGDPFTLSDWQKFIIWCLFGWRRKEDGGRRFERSLIEIARKNGKSTFMAAIMLLLLVFDLPTEEAAEIYCVATKEAQAKIVFREAVNMIAKSKPLRKRLRPLAKSIHYSKTNSFIQILGSDSKSTDGLNTSAVVADELHEWAKRHEGLFEKITTAGGARFQPLIMFITTAGHDGSELWINEHDYFARVCESALTDEVVDDTVFGFLAAIDNHERPCLGCVKCGHKHDARASGLAAGEKGNHSLARRAGWAALFNDHCDGSGTIAADDPFDEACWPKANPNLGISVAPRYLKARANEARQRPKALNTLLRYHMNVRVSSKAKFITPELWLRGAGATAVPRGAVGFGGFDLARSNDFAAFAAVFPIGEEIHLIGQAFTCEGRDDALMTPQIAAWIKSGSLICYEGDGIDYPDIERRIAAFSKRYSIRSWAYDPMFARVVAQNLSNDHGQEVFEFTQIAKFYNEPLRSFEQNLKEGWIRHGNEPCLAWQAGNLTIVRDSRDLWMPDKSNPLAKIDEMVSVLMAYSELLFHEKNGSVYDKRDVRVLGDD